MSGRPAADWSCHCAQGAAASCSPKAHPGHPLAPSPTNCCAMPGAVHWPRSCALSRKGEQRQSPLHGPSTATQPGSFQEEGRLRINKYPEGIVWSGLNTACVSYAEKLQEKSKISLPSRYGPVCFPTQPVWQGGCCWKSGVRQCSPFPHMDCPRDRLDSGQQ